MREIKKDGRLQTTAGAVLVQRSRLVEWNSDSLEFLPVSRDCFESSWKRDIDPTFGRLICWIQFSAGMEYWLKGLCLLNDIEIRRTKRVGRYPDMDIVEWARGYIRCWESHGTDSVTNYGALGDLTKYQGTPRRSHLSRLMVERQVDEEDQQIVEAAFLFLTKTIRNRDAHGYVPSVRDSHHTLVENLFVPCLNITLAWIPEGRSFLDRWINKPEELVVTSRS